MTIWQRQSQYNKLRATQEWLLTTGTVRSWFLEQMIDLADEPLDSRTMQYLLAGTESQDGGAYDMAVALIEEYGLVPQSGQWSR